MNKILTILAAICAIACTSSKTGIFMDGMLSKANPDFASNPDIKWNFTKFLIDRKGRVVARFEPVVTPERIVPEIEALL